MLIPWRVYFIFKLISVKTANLSWEMMITLFGSMGHQQTKGPTRYDENSEAFWHRVGLPDRADKLLGRQLLYKLYNT